MTGPMVVLGDIVSRVETGRSPKTLEREAAPFEPGVLKVSAVSWGRFDPMAAKAMPLTFSAPPHHRVRRGDLIISRANTAELTGAVAISDDDYPNRYLSDKLLRLVIDPARVLPEYLLFALRSPRARQHIMKSASGTSDSMRNIGQAALFKTPVRLPALAEQRQETDRLASALALVDAAFLSVSGQRAAADQLAQSWFRGAFAGIPVSVKPGGQANGQWDLVLKLARLESGHTPSRRRPEWWGGHVPWLALPDIRKLHGKVAHATTENTNDAGL